MKYLLDTHCWLWWVLEPDLLGPQTHRAIAEPKNFVYLSAASTWEATIKASIGKLSLPGGIQQFVKESYERDGFQPLPVIWEHSLGISDLPVLHKDPFDRLLIAQALYENAILVTADPLVSQYPVKVLDASA